MLPRTHTMFPDLTFQPVWPWPMVAGLAAVALGATAWSYHRQRALASRARRGLLLAFRLAGVASLLFILLRPMTHAPAPVAKDRPVLFVDADFSLSMNTPDCAGTTRWAAVASALRAGEGTHWWQLARDYDLRFATFGNLVQPDTLSALAARPRAEAQRTDLTAPLAAAADEARARPVAGVCLLGDGRENAGGDPMAAALALKAAGVPVFAACVGAGQDARDVYCRARFSQNFLFAGQPAELDVAVAHSGYDRFHVNVQLAREGRPVATKQAVLNQGVVHVPFPIQEDHRGLFTYTVKVDPLPGEGDTRNNERTLFARVVDRKTRVLIVEGRPYWDTKFLQRTLQQDPNVEVDAVFQLSAGKTFGLRQHTSEDDLVKRTAPAPLGMPRTREELYRYDCVILGRGLDRLVDRDTPALLRDFVSERGGSLVFFRGTSREPLAGLSDLEPVIWDEASLRDVRLEITPEGRASPVFAFHQEQPPEVVVRALPALVSVTRTRGEKALSVVLAAATPPGVSTGRVAALAYHRFGLGKVMSIGAAGLWRWAFLPDAQDEVRDVYAQFWGQLVRWMVSDSDFLPGTDLSLRTDRYVYQPGERVRFIVRSKMSRTNEIFHIEVTPPDGPATELAAAYSAESGGFTALGATGPEGVYRAVLRGAGTNVVEARYTAYADLDEARLVASDPDLLANICRTTGGKMLGLDELGQLPKLLGDWHRRAREEAQPADAWDTRSAYFFIALFFSIEWYFRRRWGLV